MIRCASLALGVVRSCLGRYVSACVLVSADACLLAMGNPFGLGRFDAGAGFEPAIFSL